MIANLIKEHGFRWDDLNDMTNEDLYDIINAKAEKKKKKKTIKQESKPNPSSSMEDFLRGHGLL